MNQMKKKNCEFIFSLIFFLILISSFNINEIKSADLTKQNPLEKKIYFKGKIGSEHYYEPNYIEFKTGKLYKLILINNSDSKHYFTSLQFSKSIFTRKVQISFEGKKLAEIKGNIDEIEVFPNHEIEWWFIPIKTGTFKDLHCKVLDKKTGKTHSQMGMKGNINIK